MKTTLLLAALSGLVQCRETVVESIASLPLGWKKVRDADPSTQLKLRIALEQPNTAVFEQKLYDVSNPEHPLYGRHLEREELAQLLAPRDESTSAVLNWLREAGVPGSKVENDGDWINFQVSVSKAEEMLGAKFGVYRYLDSGVDQVRALAYSVPEEVKEHITFIAPIIRFGQPKAQRSQVFEVVDAQNAALTAAKIPPQTLNVTACNATITPECLRALYRVGSYQADPSKRSLFGVAGYLEEYAKYDQLELFESVYAPYASGANFSVVQINGGGNNQTDTVDDDVEANLDIQYAVSMSYKTPIVYYSTGGRGPLVPDLDQPIANESSNEPYLEFLTYLLKQPNSALPQTLTTSYGEDEQSVPRSYAEKVCQMFGQLGARGVSVIFSSGDTGPGSACQTNDGKNTTRFLPIFPGACPYVTSVGATRYVEPEAAVSFSSGGFSDIFPRPVYQALAVSGYLKQLGKRWNGLYNPNGRGFPDVAAQGVRYHVFDYDKDILVSGTSASAPMFAALVSLLNNARLAKNLPPMGFLNPWLYTVGWAGLTDIVQGGSSGCTGRDIYSGLPAPYVPYAGWNATPGWDPVTGLGTPLFDKLLDLSTPGWWLPKIGGH
ncbi:subtilisin-like protein [Canariomyces notabilis]|uniref:tripeptidyl-peptidase II n=1 Tax=Canariomyces notabilis TaxID=2074819 RepID=A0AAN6QCN4_9PEZI|nr:subtilisin-like protein [Canariomyces arenarius]